MKLFKIIVAWATGMTILSSMAILITPILVFLFLFKLVGVCDSVGESLNDILTWFLLQNKKVEEWSLSD